MPHRDIVVIGSSHGGFEPLSQLIEGLSDDLQASVFIVRHIPADSCNYLVEILNRKTSLSVTSAVHCEAIEKETIYVAPADYHLLINKHHTILNGSPRENLCRPAIDPLFRSAAVAFGPRVIGIILSGELDDGTAGLLAVKKCGGITMVQDPATAISSSMPASASRYVPIDYCLSAFDLGKVVNGLVKEKVPNDFSCPMAIRAEMDLLSSGTAEKVPVLEDIGSLFAAGCPSCGGPLWQLEGELPRFRCHVGHAFTGQSVAHDLQTSQERALYAALRALEERIRMLKRLTEKDGGNLYTKRLREAEEQARQLRFLLPAHNGGVTC